MPRHNTVEVAPYTPEQMFELVADIESYPNFLPWCRAARVRERRSNPQGEELLADLVLGFHGLTERYTSRVQLNRAHWAIDVAYVNGPFRFLKNAWTFHDAPGGCEIRFDLDFELRSRLLQKLLGMMFLEAARKMTLAFRRRADALYGQNHPVNVGPGQTG